MDDIYYFALTIPFSYSECQQMLSEFDKEFQYSKEIYYKREFLVESIEKRRVDLITISSFDDITNEHEELIPNLFPYSSSNIERPFK